MFNELIISGGNFEAGAINTRLELKSTDESENVLKQIFQKLLAPKQKDNNESFLYEVQFEIAHIE